MFKSFLDNDFYKSTMQQWVLHNFPRTYVEYDLSIRSNGIDLRDCIDELKQELINLNSTQLSPEEFHFLSGIRFISKDYIEWLSNFRFDVDRHIKIYEKDNNLAIRISGNWLNTILYEVPVLSILSEIYHKRIKLDPLKNCTEKLFEKIAKIKEYGDGFKFADFGTRRRYSYFIHDHVVETLARELPNNFIGTSNMYLAMKYNLKPIGTMAHEIIQCAQALYPLPTHHADVLYSWGREFRGDLGYALSDTLGVDYFLKNFSLDLAKLFDGTRQDSGDPYSYGRRIINHYEQLGIDPKTKYIVFSDALDFDKAYELYKYFNNYINVSFGIGTNLTNDCGVEPLSIVIKVQDCNGIPVVKLSNTVEKTMGRDRNYLEFIKTFVENHE